MSKYPQEIVKQAEELICQQGRVIFSGYNVRWLLEEQLKKSTETRQAIGAAIVSCEFAIELLGIGDLSEKPQKIKSYLEELL